MSDKATSVIGWLERAADRLAAKIPPYSEAEIEKRAARKAVTTKAKADRKAAKEKQNLARAEERARQRAIEEKAKANRKAAKEKQDLARAEERARQRAIEEQERARQLAVKQQQDAEVQAYQERLAWEAYYRRIAMDAARKEAEIFVDNLGYSWDWVRSCENRYDLFGWAPKPEEREKYLREFDQRHQKRLQHVEHYTAQILARNDNSQERAEQQNAFGDAGFAQGAHVLNADHGTTANKLTFRD